MLLRSITGKQYVFHLPRSLIKVDQHTSALPHKILACMNLDQVQTLSHLKLHANVGSILKVVATAPTFSPTLTQLCLLKSQKNYLKIAIPRVDMIFTNVCNLTLFLMKMKKFLEIS